MVVAQVTIRYVRGRVICVARKICNLMLRPVASVEPLEFIESVRARRAIRHFQKI
jgi:hypothetical protein